uniref:SH3 domain-containing protein n=1 Tax=Myripristis murdjan TaxID=586833 RepID=A0A667YU50_9TELE
YCSDVTFAVLSLSPAPAVASKPAGPSPTPTNPDPAPVLPKPPAPAAASKPPGPSPAPVTAPAPAPGLKPPAPALRKGPPPQTKPDAASTANPNPSDPPLPPRPSGVKLLPLRPPPIKSIPGRPPPPAINTTSSSATNQAPPPAKTSPAPSASPANQAPPPAKTSPAPSASPANQAPPPAKTSPAPSASPANQVPPPSKTPSPANQTQSQKTLKRGPPLPPRPKPGHPLYGSYVKQEVLVVLDDPSPAPSENLLGEGRAHTVVTPLIDQSQCLLDLDIQPEPAPDMDNQSKRTLEGLGLSESQSILPVQKEQPEPAAVSGPRCVAKFDYEGEEEDELTFSQGDVIALLELIGQEWGRGQIHGRIGIFPLSFTEVVEPLPQPPSPGETAEVTPVVATDPTAVETPGETEHLHHSAFYFIL